MLALSTITLHAKPTLQEKLMVQKEKDSVIITFKVSEQTDVTVSIIDDNKNIIRHLAAGLIGPGIQTVEPLQADLSQKLSWDLKDDFGKDVSDLKLSVKLTIGTNIQFGKFIGQDPYIFGEINSLAFDEENKMYLMSYIGGYNQNMDSLRVFSNTGKYIKSLIPFSETLKPESIQNVATWNEARKSFMPINKRSQLPEFYPWGANASLVSANQKAGIVLTCNNQLYKMNIDGSDIKGPFPLWNAEAKLVNPAWNIPQMASSPDGKYLYIANVAGTKYDPKSEKETDPNWPQGRVYRLDLTQTGKNPEVFYDLELPDYATNKYWLPNAWNKRTAAYSVNVDSKGQVYICDLVNQAIVEVSPAGKKVSITKVPWPERINIDPDSGDYYVIGRKEAPKDGYVPKILYKIKGRGAEGVITAQASLEKWRGLGASSAVAKKDGQTVIWLSGGNDLICMKEDGVSFSVIKTDFQPSPGSQQDWNRIATDYNRDEVYASNGTNLIYRYNGETGAGGVLKKKDKIFNGVDIAVAYDGALYIRSGEGYSGPLERYTYDLEPLPFKSGTHVITKYVYSRYGVGNCEKGVGVGPNGESYINFMYGWNEYFIAGFDCDGNVIKGNYLKGKIKPDLTRGAPPEQDSAVVGPLPAACGGVRVDLQGNIYVGMRLLSKDYKLASGYEKNQAYTTWTGCIAKFPKGGGTILDSKTEPEKDQPVHQMNRNTKIAGALKVYSGIGPFSGDEYGSGGSCCVCRIPRFDIDRYGRLCYTNGVTNSVSIIDNNGNLIKEFGTYGNFDTNNNSETVQKEVIPFAWPIGAGFTKNHIYTLDAYNRRVVQTNYVFDVEAIEPIK